MASFEEYSASAMEQIRQAEEARTAADARILDTEAKLSRVSNLIKEEFRTKQQENAALRGTIQQFKFRADETVTQIEDLKRSHSEDKEFQESILRDQLERLRVAEEYHSKQLAVKNASANAALFQQELEDMRQQVAAAQQRIQNNVASIREELSNNEISIATSTQKLIGLRSSLGFMLPEGPKIEMRLDQAQSRNVAYEKRFTALKSALDEAERVHYALKERQREEKERIEKQDKQIAASTSEPPPKPPGSSPIPRRASIIGRGERSNSVSNLTYDIYKREVMTSLTPTSSPKPSPRIPHSPVIGNSPLMGSGNLVIPSSLGPLGSSASESSLDLFDDLINDVSPKPVRKNSVSDETKLPNMLELKVILPSKQYISVLWNHFTDNVATVKKSLHKLLVEQKLWPIGEARTIEEYIFKTTSDNYIADEFVLLKSTAYLVYCFRKKIIPELFIVPRQDQKYFLSQVGTILGDVPIAEGAQANYFRDQMVGLLEEIGRTRKVIVSENWQDRIEETKEALDLDVLRRRGSTATNLNVTRAAKSPEMKMSAELKFKEASSPDLSRYYIGDARTAPDVRSISVRDLAARDSNGDLLGPTCTIRVYLSSEIAKTFTCEATATVGDVQNIIFAKYLKDLSFIHKTDDITFGDFKKSFVLKPRGMDDFLLMQKYRLVDIEYINHFIRRKKNIILILVNISQQSEEDFDSYMETFTNAKGELGEEEYDDYGRPTEGPEYTPTWKVTRPLRVKIGGIKNMPQVQDAEGSKVYVTLGLYQQGELLSSTLASKPVVFSTNPSWLAWIDVLPYNNIPWGTTMHIRLYMTSVKSKSAPDILLAWVNHRIIDYKDCINSGFFTTKMWVCPATKENPAAMPRQSEDPSAPVLTFEIEMVRPVPFYSDMVASDFAQLGLTPPSITVEIKRDADKAIVDKVIATDPLFKPTPEQLAILWKSRYYCRQRPKSIAKLLQAVPWKDSTCVYETYSMLNSWARLDPAESLELFNPKFTDRQIRRFAIKCLRKMGDLELSNYLLQMVQALKHETNHDSPLAHFLLRRALMNRLQIGQPFFWQLKAELQAGAKGTEWGERFALVLEAFMRGCGLKLREDFFSQYEVYAQLKVAALAIKPLAADKRRESLKQQLALIKLPPNGFPLPTNPALRGKVFELDKVKSMQSKTAPLWLVFTNYDPFGDPVLSMFKAGDDLRQDQLTLQMIKIMDRMWYDAGLDLQVIHYRCVSTGPDEGWIEIVTDAVTIADIQKGYGGVTAAFSESAIANWLREKNNSDWEYAEAVEHFIHSCASSCVATYLLGIGDRHNDNIMIQRSGHLFHIDFGRFLGNYQTWNGIKRERAPFVFPPSFAYVMGGENHANFKRFVELCGKAYNTLRKNAHIFLNLFMMMVGTGLPELTCPEDINYLRDAFKLDKNDEKAADGFTKKIIKSMNSKATELNFAVHIMANPN